MSEDIWQSIRKSAEDTVEVEPIMCRMLYEFLLNHSSLASSLGYVLSKNITSEYLGIRSLLHVFKEMYAEEPSVVDSAVQDLMAVVDNDPAISDYLTVFLYLKGFHALQTYRLSNYLWRKRRFRLALHLQSVISNSYGVDIHPASQIGCGVMFDHATGIVIGETCVVEDNVTLFQGVTLGGTGTQKTDGPRHPTVRNRAVVGAGSIVLGNIEIGAGAVVGANSVVLSSVSRNATVVGAPARVVASNEPAPRVKSAQKVGLGVALS